MRKSITGITRQSRNQSVDVFRQTPEKKKQVEDWLLENRVYVADMEPYFQYYPNMIKKIVKGLFK